MCSGYLEVHISEEVFKSLDICQNDIVIICFACYQTAGNTSYRFLDWYTCCHQRHSRCTDTCLRCRTVGFKCLRYSTDRIWEFLFAWKYRNQCSLSKCTMSDFTTSRSSGWFCLTYRVRWEVIVMHISLCSFKLIKSIKSLCFCKRSKSCDCTDLCLSTCEHSRTMYSRDDICLCCQRTDLCDRTAIRTFVIF